MDFDDQLHRYFGTADLASVHAEALQAGLEKMHVDLGLEKDSGRRFALWTVLYMLGSSPDIDEVFEDPAERDSARDFMDLIDRAKDN
ncbi:MAG: hypothetical protein ABJO01_13940 [Parasphingorhabdus sp.]|uniref:hypothetical protein n=1 Tax=Parasphingorhabdus sp. TaxID=2709688 RepID=UPI003297D324